MERILKSTLKNGCFDNVTPERSRIMSSIRSKRNKSTELALRMALVRAKIRGWVLHPNEIPGRPDFFFPKKRLAIFVDGCFWHGCHRCGHVPRTNRSFWALKIKRNQSRDLANNKKLRRTGTCVLRFWEHELRGNTDRCVAKIAKLR
jgi:DNA mismatch endonuclease (patch repair protein)